MFRTVLFAGVLCWVVQSFQNPLTTTTTRVLSRPSKHRLSAVTTSEESSTESWDDTTAILETGYLPEQQQKTFVPRSPEPIPSDDTSLSFLETADCLTEEEPTFLPRPPDVLPDEYANLNLLQLEDGSELVKMYPLEEQLESRVDGDAEKESSPQVDAKASAGPTLWANVVQMGKAYLQDALLGSQKEIESFFLVEDSKRRVQSVVSKSQRHMSSTLQDGKKNLHNAVSRPHQELSALKEKLIQDSKLKLQGMALESQKHVTTFVESMMANSRKHFQEAVSGPQQELSTLKETVVDGGKEKLQGMATSAVEGAKNAIQGGKMKVQGIALESQKQVVTSVSSALDNGKTSLKEISDSKEKILNDSQKKMQDMVLESQRQFSTFVENLLQDGKKTLQDAVAGAMQGVNSATQAAFDGAAQAVDSAVETVNREREIQRIKATPVAKFFGAWNYGDVEAALTQFAPDCTFEDADFAMPLQGKAALRRFMLLHADAHQTPRKYVLDDISISKSGDKIGVKYHWEQDGTEVAHSRRCGFYNIDPDTKLINSVYDVAEPSVKKGLLDLTVLSLVGKLLFNTDDEGNNVVLQKILSKVPNPLTSIRGWFASTPLAAFLRSVALQYEAVQKKFVGEESSVTVVEEETSTPSSSAVLSMGLAQTSDVIRRWGSSLVVKPEEEEKVTITAPERFFDAWNRRDLDAAVDLFSENCEYEDVVFPNPYSGRDALKRHLTRCAKAIPPSFRFVVDDIANGGNRLAVRWHMENNGKELPYSRACSFYTINPDTGKIETAIDEMEPALWKPGGVSLFLDSLKTKLANEQERLFPLVTWVAYVYIVFLSDGILPGANALQLEPRAWEEVRDLALNVFLISPLLNLPFAPVVHPILVSVFNLLLAWAALFAGFFSDEREDKPNLLPVLPTVLSMQLLTAGVLLPYLATRSSETLRDGESVYREDLAAPARIVENGALGPLLGTVGAGSIAWGILARQADFGDWKERVASFWELISMDRVGSSFLVDLVLFGIFQGWLIDDDLRRRGVRVDKGELRVLRNVAKFVPFFGLAVYMSLRPTFPSRASDGSSR